MLGMVKTTLDEGGTRVEFVSPKVVVESDMMKGGKKKDASLWNALIPCRNK
jgi:hypothetical protein